MGTENTEGLLPSGPACDLADKLDLYGRFVGKWELDWKGPGPDGRPSRRWMFVVSLYPKTAEPRTGRWI